MYIYILNLLHDGLKKKNNIFEHSVFEIVNDTLYISELAGVIKSSNFKNINDKITYIFEILNKYNLTSKDSIDILNLLMRDKNNSWLAENYYKSDYKEEAKLPLSLIINNKFDKAKRIEEYM